MGTQTQTVTTIRTIENIISKPMAKIDFQCINSKIRCYEELKKKKNNEYY